MDLKVVKVPLSDFDSVTRTTVKVKGPLWTLNIKKGIDLYSESKIDGLLRCSLEAARFVEGEISKICASWDQTAWDELDWSRIKELTTRDILERRQHKGSQAQQAHAFDCPNFVKHVRSIVTARSYIC